jgi:diaminohydroxyphosphoribosylaminopyrimidine deaminase/5-amino-6-(5-phosphoribosylamino)uracil reductase
VIDRRARLPLSSRLVQSAGEAPVVVLVAPDAPSGRRAALEEAGVETLAVDGLADALQALAARDVQTVLFEGGATLAGALLREELIDRVALFVAPRILGDPSAPGLFGEALAPATVAEGLAAVSLEPERVGADILLDAWVRDPL